MKKNIRVDVRMQSYQPFFDHKWAEHLMAVAEPSPLRLAAFDLCAAWRGVSNTHAMPYLMLEQFRAFAKGLLQTEWHGAKWIGFVQQHLESDIGDGLTNMAKRKIRTSLGRLEKKFNVTMDNAKFVELEKDILRMWDQHLENFEMQIILWGSQRLCYAAVYYAYEDFLTQAVALQKGDPQYRMPRRTEFGKDLANEFGRDVRDRCWSELPVQVARVTRHALVHNGGRVTEELDKLSHGLTILDGEIQIMATDTSGLYSQLKGRATFLVERHSAPE